MKMITPLLFMLFLATSVPAGTVTLAWDPSPSPGVTGYKLWQGGSSRVYTNSTALGSVLAYTVQNVVSGKNYFFAVTAYGSSGGESDFSNEVVYQVPASYTVDASVNPVGGGTVTGDTGTWFTGKAVNLTAVPSTGYSFKNWTEGTVTVSTNAVYSFMVANTNRVLVANFTALPIAPTNLRVTNATP